MGNKQHFHCSKVLKQSILDCHSFQEISHWAKSSVFLKSASTVVPYENMSTVTHSVAGSLSHPCELFVFSITDLFVLPSYKASSLRNERVKGYHIFSSANCELRHKTNKNCLLKGVKSYEGAPGCIFNHEEVQSLAMSVLLNHD